MYVCVCVLASIKPSCCWCWTRGAGQEQQDMHGIVTDGASSQERLLLLIRGALRMCMPDLLPAPVVRA